MHHRKVHIVGRVLAVAAVLAFSSGCAEASKPLLELINDFRDSPRGCEGRKLERVGPLAPSRALQQVEIGSRDTSLNEALRKVEYSAARVQAIVISGPRSERAAMEALEERYCSVIMSKDFSEIGISRDGRTWRFVLAQPLLSPDLGGWKAAADEVLELVNQARAQPRTCGDQRFGAAPPVSWNNRLAQTALAHSRDMAQKDYFAHEAKDGSTVEQRADRQGYNWKRIGENIATGQGSPKQVVAGWLASPVHCVNIMDPRFTEMGAAYVHNTASRTGIFWTQVFGTPAR